MIRDVEGDILLSGCHVIAHGIAPGDHFDSGLALALRERWPLLAKDFRHYCQQHHPAPGGAWVWAGPDDVRGSVQIVNLLTQEPAPGHHGGKPGKASLAHVRHSLKELAHLAKTEAFTSVALPRLATGVGGLEWDDVKPLITQYLGGLGLPIIIYARYRAGVKATEGPLPA